MEGGEVRKEPVSEAQVAKETNKLVEKIGKDKVRAIASLGLAAATLLGISGKPETGVGLGIDVPDPFTGRQVTVGVISSSTEGEYPMGLPSIPGKEWHPGDKLDVYQVRIGNAMVGVYTESHAGNSSVIKTIGIYPGFETFLRQGGQSKK